MSAHEFDIFSGGLIGIHYTEDTKNTDPKYVSYEEVPECAAFPETGIERGTIDVPNFSSPYNRKLVGRMSVPDIELSVNYIPKSVHDKMHKAAENGKRVQIKITYYTDATKAAGLYIVYNGIISKSTMSGGEEEVVKRNYTFAVDGAPVATGIITPEV